MTILEEMDVAILEATKKFKEDHNRKLEEGDQFVVTFKNCYLVVSIEKGELITNFINGKPYEIDMTISIYNV